MPVIVQALGGNLPAGAWCCSQRDSRGQQGWWLTRAASAYLHPSPLPAHCCSQHLQRLKFLPTFGCLDIWKTSWARAMRSEMERRPCVSTGEVILDLNHSSCSDFCLPYTSCRPSACFHELCSVMCSAWACDWCELWADLSATVRTKFPLIFPGHTLYRIIKGPWLLSLWCMCFSLWFSSLVTQHQSVQWHIPHIPSWRIWICSAVLHSGFHWEAVVWSTGEDGRRHHGKPGTIPGSSRDSTRMRLPQESVLGQTGNGRY